MHVDSLEEQATQKRIAAGQDTDSYRSVGTVDRDMGTDLDMVVVKRQVEADTNLAAAAESSVVEAEHRAELEDTAGDWGVVHTIQETGHMQAVVAEGIQALLLVQENTQVADYRRH